MQIFSLRICYFFLVFSCLTFRGFGQDVNSSKHKEIWADDSSRVQMLLEKGKRLENSVPDSAAYYFEKAKSITTKLNDREGLSHYFSQYIRFLNYKAQFEEGLSNARQHLELGRKLNDSSIIMIAFNELANEEEYLSDFQSATGYYLKALKFAVRLQNKRMQRLINNNLSSVFISLKDYQTAYKYSQKAFRLAQNAGDTTVMGDCLINMGISEIHQLQYQQALSDFSEAEYIGYKEPDMSLVADALSDQGLVYYDLHQLTASESQYQKQENIAVKYEMPYEQLYALFELAVVKKEKGNLSAAEKYASRAIAIGERLGTKDELAEMYDTMAVIKAKSGHLSEAISYKNKFEAMKDTLMNAQVQTNIHHLELQYRSAQKDKEIAQQALKIERNNSALQRKNTLISVILAGLLALIAILVLSYRSHRHKQKLNKQQMLMLQKEHEVNTLKAKMQAREEERDRIGREMHDDIGSALTTILYKSEELKSNAGEKDRETVKSITDTASAVMDKMNEIIWSMNSDYDTLEDLIVYTRQHAVEFLQNHNLKYQFTVPEELPVARLTGEQRRNIYLVVKEALNNVVKHSCASKVSISFQLQNELFISIHDNGKGLDEEASGRFGNGLKNMRRRMDSVGGSFEIQGKQGTAIHLRSPLNLGDT